MVVDCLCGRDGVNVSVFMPHNVEELLGETKIVMTCPWNELRIMQANWLLILKN